MPIVSLRFKYFAFAFLFTIIFLGLWLQPMYLGVVSLSDPANPLTRHVDASRRKFDANPYTNDRSIYRVQNETLGFQEVYMISLPARTDKRDAFALQAAFSGITYTQVDGVDGHDVPEKALPHVGLWIRVDKFKTDRND